MEKLNEKFKKNGLLYRLIRRNKHVALYAVSGSYTDKTIYYEVCKIHLRKDKWGIREALPSNEQFGRDGSIAVIKIEDADCYYETLSSVLKSMENAQNCVKSDIVNARVDKCISREVHFTPVTDF